MENIHLNDSENEYRLHLRNEALSNPGQFAEYTRKLGVESANGYKRSGRGVLVLVDDGADGVHAYVPAEVADMQFGSTAVDLCKNYDPTTQWILIGITNGRTFPIVMSL